MDDRNSKSLQEVTAMILAGGLGTRLRPVLADRPKVLAPVHGRPFLEFILEQLHQAGIRQAVVCTGYLADQVETAFGANYKGITLRYSRENALLGTGGALRFALALVTTPTVLVVNGDSYCETNLTDFYAWHREKKSSASLLLTQMQDLRRFGRVNAENDGTITAFEEKGVETGPGWINAGVYLIETTRLRALPAGHKISLEREVFPAWIPEGLWGFHATVSKFIDIGTPDSLREAAQTVQPLKESAVELS